MPIVNAYFKEDVEEKVASIMEQLKERIAEELSTGERALSSSEISVRFIGVNGGDMIANVEFHIIAHAYADRVKQQDEICLRIMNYITELTGIDNRVWLQLSELGHSWNI